MVLIINFIYAGLFLTKLKRTSHKCIKKKGAKKHTQTLKQGKKKKKESVRIYSNSAIESLLCSSLLTQLENTTAGPNCKRLHGLQTRTSVSRRTHTAENV